MSELSKLNSILSSKKPINLPQNIINSNTLPNSGKYNFLEEKSFSDCEERGRGPFYLAEQNGGKYEINDVIFVVFNNDFNTCKIRRSFSGIWKKVYESNNRVLCEDGLIYYLSGSGKQKIIPEDICQAETKRRRELLPIIYSKIDEFMKDKISNGKVANYSCELFGSLSYGVSGPDSDIDIYISFDSGNIEMFNELKDYLQKNIDADICISLRLRNYSNLASNDVKLDHIKHNSLFQKIDFKAKYD